MNTSLLIPSTREQIYRPNINPAAHDREWLRQRMRKLRDLGNTDPNGSDDRSEEHDTIMGYLQQLDEADARRKVLNA